MKITIKVTHRECFAFQFICKHNGKGIPYPLPDPVLSLIKKGLVRSGKHLTAESKIQCWLTPVGEKCLNI